MEFSKRYGPWALIAGASEGTGAQFARGAAKRGLSCILIARRAEPLADLAASINDESGVECITASIDLARADAADRVIAAAAGRDVGLCVFNAGSDPNGALFLDASLGAWMDLTQRNTMTTMACCHHFAGAMRQRGRGGLVLVGSGAGYGGSAFNAVYCATKAYEMCLAEGLWAELKPHGIDVLSLMLGTTDTPFLRAHLARLGAPLPDRLANAADVAELGLARLSYGPVCNVGLADDQPAGDGQSAFQRRDKVTLRSRYVMEFMGIR